jgi:hypothetical protein
MDRSRKASREGNEVTLHHRSQQDSLLDQQLVVQRLAELQASLDQLKQTPKDAAMLQRRVKALGDCQRGHGETSAQFYERLHHWLERELPPTKSPLHPPRQTGG